MKTRAVVFAILCFGLAVEGLAQPSDAPPKLEPVPDGAPTVGPAPSGAARSGQSTEEPVITIRRAEGTEYKEYRVRGQLYAVRVTPAVGKPYWLIDRTGSGTFKRVDGSPTENFIVPQWPVLEW
ncbi:MAG TPA: DUF2782 domain-containing protein [Burkholderiaceae bacterium]|nr:DUF2782 domain-containing protein [Burkholderiaceae bacterium]